MRAHRACWTALADPVVWSKKYPNRFKDINGKHVRPQPLLPGHVQVIRNHVRFDGWDGKEPCGKTTFHPDTECPPNRGGLGWQVDRNARKRPRSIYPDNGRRPKAVRFIGPIDQRTTQSSRCGVPGYSEGSDSVDDEPPRPDRRRPHLHHNHPNHHNCGWVK